MTSVSLTLEQAWKRLEAAAASFSQPTLDLPVTQAHAHVLAEPVNARVDSPPCDNSAMDGIAVRVDDVVEGKPISVSQRIPAGQESRPLAPGTAARIFTGAEMPEGADCVVIQENCEFVDDSVIIRSGLRLGANIRRKASDVSLGDRAVEGGRRLRPQEIGLLLSSGVSHVQVFRPLRVAVIATGDELVDIDTHHGDLPPGKIFESNSPMIAARLAAMNCIPTRYRARDTRAETVRVLTQAVAENDCVLTIGGVSVGEEDHVQAALNDIGELDFWKINIKPGKPFLFGAASDTPVLGLPGNPVSSFVTFSLFCAPFLARLQGERFTPPRRLPAVAGFSRSRISDRVDHLRGIITGDYPELVVEPAGSQSSSIQGALCAADVLIVIPADTAVVEGQRLQVMLL